MIEVENKKVPHSFRNKYLRNSGSVSFSTSTPAPASGGSVNLDVLKVDDIRTPSDSNVFSSLRTLQELLTRIISENNSVTIPSDSNMFSSLRTIKEILSRIIAKDDVERELSDKNTFSSLRIKSEIKAAVDAINKLYLSKKLDDTAKGHLTLQGGATSDLLQSAGFTGGALGTGYIVKRDPQTSRSYIEVDELYVRLRAVFDSIEIKEAKHVAGELILSSASVKCTKVEFVNSESLYDSEDEQLLDSDGFNLFGSVELPVYRCYFTNDDGSKAIVNQFVAGDFAMMRQFNLKEGTHGNASSRYYWRYVEAIGDNFIDLSVNDCDEGSDIPQEGDTIIQLGNRTDVSRQNAIILSTSNNNAPSKILYQGINSYSLDGKAMIEEGFDTSTNQAYTRTFGRSYIGERDESSYMKYVPGEGLTARCSLLGMSSDGKSVYELKPDGTCFFGTSDPITGKRTGIIQGVDIMLDGKKRTGVFAVVEDEVVFELDPINKQYSFTGNISASNGDFGTLKIEGSKGYDEKGEVVDNRKITFDGPNTDGVIASREPININTSFPMPGATVTGGYRDVGMYLESAIWSNAEHTKVDPKKLWGCKTLVAYGNAEIIGIEVLYGNRFKCGLDLETREFVRRFSKNNEVQQLIKGRNLMHKQIHNTQIWQCDSYSGCKFTLPEYSEFDYSDYARSGGNVMCEFTLIAHPSNTQPITIQSNPYGYLSYSGYPTMYNKGINVTSVQLAKGGCVNIAIAVFRDNEGDTKETPYYRAIITNIY